MMFQKYLLGEHIEQVTSWDEYNHYLIGEIMPSVFHVILIWVFTSLNLPITIVPGSYKNVKKDRGAYRPFFNPSLSDKEFLDLYIKAKPFTTLFRHRLYNLYCLANSVLGMEGDVYECGVYRGGSAFVLAELCRRHGTSPERLHLFDTFGGMPVADSDLDRYAVGSFSDTSLDSVKELLAENPEINVHPGIIPNTFSEVYDTPVRFAHIDVDQYESTKDCVEFIFPRLAIGGVMLIDDYGFPACYGAREAVDDYFENRLEKPLALPTGQAVIWKFN
jgi:O-methyltransferase